MSESDLGQKLDVILREHGARNRTDAEAAFFLDFIEKQHRHHMARRALILARYDLDRAQAAMDAGTGQPPWVRPVPTVAETEAKKAAEIADSERLMAYVAEASRRILHPQPYQSEVEKAAVAGLGAFLAAKMHEMGLVPDDINLGDWQLIAGAAIEHLSEIGATAPKEA